MYRSLVNTFVRSIVFVESPRFLVSFVLTLSYDNSSKNFRTGTIQIGSECILFPYKQVSGLLISNVLVSWTWKCWSFNFKLNSNHRLLNFSWWTSLCQIGLTSSVLNTKNWSRFFTFRSFLHQDFFIVFKLCTKQSLVLSLLIWMAMMLLQKTSQEEGLSFAFPKKNYNIPF